MTANDRLSRKQQQFIQGLLLGQSIVAAAAAIGISEKTAHRWLKLPAVQAERNRLEAEIQQAEQAEIERILTTGYAAVHNRVKALDDMARLIEKSYRQVDTGDMVFQWFTPEKIKEWRGCLDDIAKELGQRVKKQEIEHSVLVDLLNSEHASLLAELGALPDARQGQEQTSPTGTDTASPSA